MNLCEHVFVRALFRACERETKKKEIKTEQNNSNRYRSGEKEASAAVTLDIQVITINECTVWEMDKVDEGLMISLGASHTPSGNGQVPRFTCSEFVFKGQEVCFLFWSRQA